MRWAQPIGCAGTIERSGPGLKRKAAGVRSRDATFSRHNPTRVLGMTSAPPIREADGNAEPNSPRRELEKHGEPARRHW